MNLSPDEYKRLTYREYLLKTEGYGRVQVEQYRKVRAVTFAVAAPYLKDKDMTAYDFWPLEGDPTPEERAQQEQEQISKEMEAAQQRRQKILTDFRKRNGRT